MYPQTVVGIIIWGRDVKETEGGNCIIKRQRSQRKDSAGRLRRWWGRCVDVLPGWENKCYQY